MRSCCGKSVQLQLTFVQHFDKTDTLLCTTHLNTGLCALSCKAASRGERLTLLAF